MKNLINLLFIVIQVSIFSQEEFKYNSHVETLPNWIQLKPTQNFMNQINSPKISIRNIIKDGLEH
jgi:hypothetical protein